jgi:hypothetical protein
MTWHGMAWHDLVWYGMLTFFDMPPFRGILGIFSRDMMWDDATRHDVGWDDATRRGMVMYWVGGGMPRCDTFWHAAIHFGTFCGIQSSCGMGRDGVEWDCGRDVVFHGMVWCCMGWSGVEWHDDLRGGLFCSISSLNPSMWSIRSKKWNAMIPIGIIHSFIHSFRAWSEDCDRWGGFMKMRILKILGGGVSNPNPIQSSPIQSSPVQSNPIQSNPFLHVHSK